MSKVYNFKTVQVLPVSMEKAWDFFSSPSNLSTITPAKLQFRIISVHQGEDMYPGQLIEYTVNPILGIPLYWMTEITHVEHHKYFIDEQRFGPYSFWHHQHLFRRVADGIEMTDIVHYKLPFGFIGDIVQRLFVQNRLKEIFNYRYAVVGKKWPVN
ncbi:MAG: SRPBCC family protein [Ferruginibacter sp.]